MAIEGKYQDKDGHYVLRCVISDEAGVYQVLEQAMGTDEFRLALRRSHFTSAFEHAMSTGKKVEFSLKGQIFASNEPVRGSKDFLREALDGLYAVEANLGWPGSDNALQLIQQHRARIIEDLLVENARLQGEIDRAAQILCKEKK